MGLRLLNTEKYAEQYGQALFEDCIPFWERHSIDHKYGGYLTSLERNGEIFDTDKYTWPIGRQAWTFAMLYNRYEPREEWLKMSKVGVEFLSKYGMDEEGKFYFAFDQKGAPLKKPSNIFSDCFAALGFSQYALASGEEQYRDLSLEVFNRIQARWPNPKGVFNKDTGIRPMSNMTKAMINLNMVLEMTLLLDKEVVKNIEGQCIHDLLDLHYDSDFGLFFENVAPDGSHPDTYDGRLITPGHAIEAMWLVMELAKNREDNALWEKSIKVTLQMLEYGWDKQYGGIFYFLDFKNRPRQWNLDWDQKLWWVHIETLIALAKAYSYSNSKEIADWFVKVHDYTWSHFPDPEYGEWYGYLNRRGEPLLTLKGSFKGCYHLPRGLFEVYQTFSMT
jgi:N-acylglucosamine 2-epimerase